jgi:hypothetical protein
VDVKLDMVFTPSEDVVAREIEGEFIIVPLTDGIGDMEEELYSMNETGLAIWKCLDGKTTLEQVVALLSEQYSSEPGEIENDVLGLINELVKRKILVEI